MRNHETDFSSDPDMQALRTRYLAHVADRLQAFEACVAPYDRVWLSQQAHALTGSGGSFGFWRISDSACALEALLKDIPDAGDHDIRDHLTRLCDAMSKEV